MRWSRRLVAVGAAAGVVLGASGCGFGGSASCDFRNGSLNGAEPRCQEMTNTVAVAQYEQTCGIAKGKYAASTCPREGIVAGCEQKTNNADGSTVIDWFYAPKTVDDVKNGCKSPSTFREKP